MSIIYDALKKVGEADKLTVPLPAAKPAFVSSHKPKVYLLYILAVVFVVGLAVLLFNPFTIKSKRPDPQISPETLPIATKQEIPPFDIAPASAVSIEQPGSLNPSANPAVDQAALSVQPQAQENLPPVLALSGVFISDNETYALVNNKIVRKGDIIDGAVVQKIAMDEVELEFGGKTIQLRNSSN